MCFKEQFSIIVLLKCVHIIDMSNKSVSMPSSLMFNDLRVLGSLSLERLENVLCRIQPKSFDIAKDIVFAEYAEQEASALWRLFDVFSAVVVGDFIEELASTRVESSFVSGSIPQDIWQNLVSTLCSIKRFFPLRCIEMHIQRERFRMLTGNTLRTTDIICDIRPIFDSFASVVGLVPLTTLKIGYRTQEEDDKFLELVLSKEHLDNLAAKIETAKKELDVLSGVGFAYKGQAKQPKKIDLR